MRSATPRTARLLCSRRRSGLLLAGVLPSPAFLTPGASDTRIFTEVRSEVYSSACGRQAASFLNVTTIFVSEPGTGKDGRTPCCIMAARIVMRQERRHA